MLEPVVAHHSAKFMFDPPNHVLASFPVMCLILVFVKISLYFVVKYSVAVTYIFLPLVEQPAEHLQCCFQNQLL